MNKEQIKEIYEDLNVPLHIRKHMAKVAEVALKLAKEYKKIGLKLDEESLESAALLHDALKICNIPDFDSQYFQQKITDDDVEKWQSLKEKYPDKSDARSMADYMRERNETKIGNLIAKHDFACVLNDLKTPEEKILYYADKRVKHDQVVSLEERLQDGRERYVYTKAQLEKTKLIEKALYKMEQELFHPLTIKPEDLN